MAIIKRKLSDLPIKITPFGNEFLHILDPTDLSDSPEGTDKRILIPKPFDPTSINNQLANKVDKVLGKGLSAENYTDTEKQKLASLPTATQLIASFDGKQDISNQLEFAGNQTISAAWHGKEITFTASGTLTISGTLPDQFNFTLATDPGVSVTFAIAAPFTFLITPPVMAPLQMCQVSRKMNTNIIRVRGL